MALSLRPPLTLTRLKSYFLERAYKVLPISLFEFALSLFISVPECPPTRPEIVISAVSPFVFSNVRGRCAVVETPPAQLTRSEPSSSESRFNIILDFRGEQSRLAAPSIPISSSTVKTASIGV